MSALEDTERTCVDLSYRSLVAVPTLNDAAWLVVLDLKGNDLEALPDLSSLRSLRSLIVSQNALAELPASIGQLRRLELLGAHGNDIRRLPESVCDLGELRVLGLGFNRIAELPDGISRLASLRQLELHNSELAALPALPPALACLQLSRNPLGAASLRSLSRLVELVLSGCGLAELPIGDAPTLQKVWANDNHFAALPDAVGRLPRLKTLWVAGCRLASLPELDLECLESLWVASNRLAALPASLAGCLHLRALWASDNALTSLPKELSYLDDLSIWLDGNPGLACDARRWRRAAVVRDAPTPRPPADPVVFVAHTNLANFGHTLLDVALPMETARRALGVDAALTFQDLKFQNVLVELLGLKLERAAPDVSRGYAFVDLPPRSATGRFQRREVEHLRATVFGRLGGAPEARYATFVRRKLDGKAIGRRLTNETALVEALERACSACAAPFRTVAPEELSPLEQVRVFASSRVVVGQHGAGLANALWLPARASLIEIGPFWDLHEKLVGALDRVRYVALERPRAGYTARIDVDVAAAGAALRAALVA